jgi:hypothetical protein
LIRSQATLDLDTATPELISMAYYVWDNTGDAATLRGPAGTGQDTCSYTRADDQVKNC